MNNNNHFDDELEQLLTDSKVKPAKPNPTLQGFMDLDDLLNESMQMRDAEYANKANREKLKRSNLSREDRAEIEAKVREWESRNLWTPVANVAVFEQVICDCGFCVEPFSHMMQQQQHKNDPNLRRLVRTDAITLSLPKLVAKQISEVPICDQCAPQKGWDLEADVPEGLEWLAAKL